MLKNRRKLGVGVVSFLLLLNKNNAETYKIYLASRPDLGETVKEYYLNLI